MLCALAESARQLVTKQELLERVWGGRAVGDSIGMTFRDAQCKYY